MPIWSPGTYPPKKYPGATPGDVSSLSTFFDSIVPLLARSTFLQINTLARPASWVNSVKAKQSEHARAQLAPAKVGKRLKKGQHFSRPARAICVSAVLLDGLQEKEKLLVV